MATATQQRSTGSTGRLTAFHRIKALFLIAAFASFLLSVGLWFAGYREEGLFVGLWVPAIHSLGTLVLTGEEKNLTMSGGRRS